MLDDDGSVRADVVEPELSEAVALKIYGNMIRLEAMDDIFYNAQRQVSYPLGAQANRKYSSSVKSTASLPDARG